MNATAHTNTNCLDGMACPRCKALGPFRMATLGPKRSNARDLTQSQLLEAVATGRMDMEVYDATWTDDGSETTVGDVELVDDGPATCLCCKFQGRVCDFRSNVDMATGEEAAEDTDNAGLTDAVGEFDIKFDITGGEVQQTLMNLGIVSDEEIIEGLNSGKYSTTLWHQKGSDRPTVDDHITGQSVAEVISQEVDWELDGEFEAA